MSENITADKNIDLTDYLEGSSTEGNERYISGKSLLINRPFRLQVLDYIGVVQKEFQDGTKTVPYLKVEAVQVENKINTDYPVKEGEAYLLGVNLSNAKFLKSKGINSFMDLKDKIIEGVTLQTKKGDSLVFTDIK